MFFQRWRCSSSSYRRDGGSPASAERKERTGPVWTASPFPSRTSRICVPTVGRSLQLPLLASTDPPRNQTFTRPVNVPVAQVCISHSSSRLKVSWEAQRQPGSPPPHKKPHHPLCRLSLSRLLNVAAVLLNLQVSTSSRWSALGTATFDLLSLWRTTSRWFPR